MGGAVRLHTIHYLRLRYREQIRQAVRILFWLVIAALVGIGAYSAMTEYRWATTEAQNAVKKAEADRQEVLDVLSGKLVMRTRGTEYYEYAEVKWKLAKEVGR